MLEIITQLQKVEYNFLQIVYKYPAILYGYLNSWLFCTVKNLFNLLHSNISMHFLHTFLYTFSLYIHLYILHFYTEFICKSKDSFPDDHFVYSHYLNV